MVRFVLGSLATVLAVGLASVYVARDIASQTALRDAIMRGGSFARGVAGPLVNNGVRQGDLAGSAGLDAVMRSRLQDGSVKHIKVWDRSGRLLWSDEDLLVGQVFSFDNGIPALFDSGGVIGSVSDLDKPENALEATAVDQLLEVYAGTKDADGDSVVIETYWSMERIEDAQWALLKDLIPLVLGGLVFVQLALLPLALTLARRVDRGLAERERIVQHALSASELERHRIAAQLHDGVIQDLAGISLALPSLASLVPRSSTEVHELLDQTRSIVLADLDSLRTMLTDLYPGSLAEGQLVAAVDELVSKASHPGLRIGARITTAPNEPLAVTRLAYRIIREAVQNVVKHAEATSALVVAGRRGSMYVVTVSDNGRGLDGTAETGHVGLALLRQTLEEIGGSLDTATKPEGGTLLDAQFPADLSDPLGASDPHVAGAAGHARRPAWTGGHRSRFLQGRAARILGHGRSWSREPGEAPR